MSRKVGWGEGVSAVRFCAQDSGGCLAPTLYTVIDGDPLIGGSSQSQGQPLGRQEPQSRVWKVRVKGASWLRCEPLGPAAVPAAVLAAVPAYLASASGRAYTEGYSSKEREDARGSLLVTSEALAGLSALASLSRLSAGNE